MGKMNSEQKMTLVGVILQSNLMAFEDFVILEASLSARVFDFYVRIFRAQSEFILSPLLLSFLIWSAARISQGLLFMKCRADLNLSSKLRLSCALSFLPLHLVDLQVSIFLSRVV